MVVTTIGIVVEYVIVVPEPVVVEWAVVESAVVVSIGFGETTVAVVEAVSVVYLLITSVVRITAVCVSVVS